MSTAAKILITWMGRESLPNRAELTEAVKVLGEPEFNVRHMLDSMERNGTFRLDQDGCYCLTPEAGRALAPVLNDESFPKAERVYYVHKIISRPRVTFGSAPLR